MRISHLSLTNYRSYTQLDLELQPGTNVLVGRNGVGKTNVAEAIGYVSTHQSHRVSNDAPLVHFGADQARIRTRVHRGERAVAVDLEINPGKSNRVAINRGAPQRAREGLGLLRSVLFAPEDLQLVNGDPGVRRRFLDDLIVQMRPALGGARSEYDRVLRQRNALLKSARTSGKWTDEHDATLAVWDEHLAVTGARLLNGRLHVLQLLAEPLATAYAHLADANKTASYRYDSAVALAAGQHQDIPSEAELAEAMREALQGQHRLERDRGVTLVGPHRDDVILNLGAAPAKGYASHGETWSLSLALRLASYDVLVADDADEHARPLLILDDVFAELDATRRLRLAALADRAEQVLVTAAVAEDLPDELEGPRFFVQMDEGVSSIGESGG
ncbi:DNA replication/repair protein RecF [Citricoccus muralis]|uniref:DNA replication and repair protein RecF n=1 Tax=Citricoccus muralis TaxID=169134 RepID=A0ABY8H791_9MICC|nr:DNA replication/repair protein RecF [Citricoccus muralis]WFP16555.1 DNA replication/repair protein RecF [Citricoccus muralis]